MNINDKLTENEQTPLMLAFLNGHIELVNYLINKKSDIYMVDKKGKNIFHFAVNAKKTVREDELNVALDLDINHNLINQQDLNGYTPLHIAISQCDFETTLILLNSGANTEITDNYDNSILHTATVLSNFQIIDAILKNNNELIHFKNRDGKTPLLHALNKIPQTFFYSRFLRDEHQVEICNLFNVFLDYGVDINETDNDGDTSFRCCAF